MHDLNRLTALSTRVRKALAESEEYETALDKVEAREWNVIVTNGLRMVQRDINSKIRRLKESTTQSLTRSEIDRLTEEPDPDLLKHCFRFRNKD